MTFGKNCFPDLFARLLVYTLPLILSVSPCFAAFSYPEDTVKAETKGNAWVELAGYGSTASRTPFWLHANQWGIVPTSGQVGSLRLGLENRKVLGKDTSANLKWTLPYGVELVGNASAHSKLLVPQAYVGIAYGSFQLTAGRWKQYVGFNDAELGTGSYMWSGNALPVPKVQLAFEKYVPLIKNFFYFKGFYSDGWLGNKRPVTSELKLHNKALFVRLGRPNGKLKLYGGFNHAVQWGGKSPYFTENGQMPRGLSNYWYVVSGFKPLNKKGISDFDRTNRVGNHVASIDAGLELDLNSVNILFYRQNLVEDGSLFYLNNVKDGLNGITFTMKNTDGRFFTVDRLTLELLYTKSQGGSVVDSTHIRGKDDYFNNAQVRDGWSYFGRGIGTPFITAQDENNWPRYADFFTNNNRVWVTHAGAKGKLGHAIWMTKLSLSSNQGTYDAPLPGGKLYQFSGLVSIAQPVAWLGGATISGAASLDQGKLFDNAIGLMLSIRKNLAF